MPITHAMYRVLYQDQPAKEAVAELLGRAPKHELG
jgi:glycerol-3-phosphate dehydrogenase